MGSTRHVMKSVMLAIISTLLCPPHLEEWSVLGGGIELPLPETPSPAPCLVSPGLTTIHLLHCFLSIKPTSPATLVLSLVSPLDRTFTFLDLFEEGLLHLLPSISSILLSDSCVELLVPSPFSCWLTPLHAALYSRLSLHVLASCVA